MCKKIGHGRASTSCPIFSAPCSKVETTVCRMISSRVSWPRLRLLPSAAAHNSCQSLSTLGSVPVSREFSHWNGRSDAQWQLCALLDPCNA